MDFLHHFALAIELAAVLIQALAAAVIVYLTFRLVRATDTYAGLTRDSLRISRQQFDRELLPHWHIALEKMDRDGTRLIVFNLSKSSARITHLCLRVEAEPQSVKQFDLDLPMPGQQREHVQHNVMAHIVEAVQPLMLEGSWQGVLEIAVVFLLAETDEPRPSKWFPYRVAVRDGHITELRPKMPYIAANPSQGGFL